VIEFYRRFSKSVFVTRRQTILTGSALLGFLLILSGILFALGINWWMSGHNSQSWPKTNGELTEINFLGSNAGRGASRVAVKYKYEIENTNYQGNRLCYGMLDSSYKELQGLHSGNRVQISFNPKDPTQSVLISGVTSGARVITFFGIFCLTVVFAGAASMWFSFRNEKT
jgi:hypothetical protein